ncbi:MAG TPA: FliH/SctL family protein, partial [Bacteroidota bacterium]|nr:FliH/SctL family protein [Bacteroidota bacterium]
GGDMTHVPGEEVPVDLNDPKDLNDMNARLHRALEQGRAEGRAEIREEMEKRLTIARTESDERIGALMEGIAQQVRAFTASLEHDAYAFALAVAERIVKREIQLDDEIVVRQVREALRRIVGVESIKVRVHPDDEVLIRSHRAALLALTDTTRDVVIEADHTIERGGCILESASGNVDARIATQLRQVEHALRVEETVPGDHRP